MSRGSSYQDGIDDYPTSPSVRFVQRCMYTIELLQMDPAIKAGCAAAHQIGQAARDIRRCMSCRPQGSSSPRQYFRTMSQEKARPIGRHLANVSSHHMQFNLIDLQYP